MKKKILFVLFLFAIIQLFYPSKSLADNSACINQPIAQGCSAPNASVCLLPSTGVPYCCKSASDCDLLKKGSITPTSGQQDPTCGTGGIGTEINTAIGCINFQDIPTFTGLILKWLVDIGGGVAFLLILSASFTIMTSNGNPERLKAGQEVMTAAVSGLILLIFSIFILKFVGVDILGLGAFGFGNQNSGGGGSTKIMIPK